MKKRIEQPIFSRIPSSSTRLFPEIHKHEEQQTSMKINKRIGVGKVSSRRVQISSWFRPIVPKFSKSKNLGFGIKVSNQHYFLYTNPFHKPEASLKSTWNKLQYAHKHEGNGDIRILTLIWRQYRIGCSLRVWMRNRYSICSKKLTEMLRIYCNGF